jgi:formiminotetrahydrofolate cyclodeaminase
MEQVRPFLDDLASSSPVPGGGSVAALSAAMGAALLVMVCNLTIGRKRFADVQDRAEGLRADAQELLRRAAELADEDARAYSRVAQAMALPRQTDNEKILRRERIQEALKGAALPPLETMHVASDVARLSADLVSFGNPSAITDVGTAALVASASHGAARLNVLVNLGAVEDTSWAADLRARLEQVPDPNRWNTDVQRQVQSAMERG